MNFHDYCEWPDSAVEAGYLTKVDYGHYKPVKNCYFVVNEKVPSRKGCIGILKEIYFDTYTIDFGNDVIKSYYYEKIDPLVLGNTYEPNWTFQRVKKDVIPPHVNKFNQVLEKGTLVVTIVGYRQTSQSLTFGKISRWNDTSVWMKPIGTMSNVINENMTKNGEIKLADYNESFVLSKDESLENQLTLAMLQL